MRLSEETAQKSTGSFKKNLKTILHDHTNRANLTGSVRGGLTSRWDDEIFKSIKQIFFLPQVMSLVSKIDVAIL